MDASCCGSPPPARSTTASRTLIGRLLYDSKAIFEDQLEAVERTSRERGRRVHEPGAAHRRPAGRARAGHHHRRRLPLLRHARSASSSSPTRPATSSTRATWSPARRPPTSRSCSSTPARASSSRARRHAFLASLLRIPHLVLCVNKMDLVDYDEDVFERIKDEFRAFATKLDVTDLTFIPISALHGDNVVNRSANMPWYEGSSLLHHLEEVHIASDRNLIDARFPVQYVIRPHDRRVPRLPRLRRQVAGGVLKPGDEVVVLPSGFTSTDRRRSTRSTARSTRRSRRCRSRSRLDRRHRRLPRRHDLPAAQPAARRPGHRRHGLLDDRAGDAAARRQVRASSTRPARPGPW